LEAIELCLVFLHREHELSRQGKQRPELFDTAHRLVMEQIQLQELSQRELAKMALMWVTFARRPLRMLELMHALALEFEDSEFNIDGLFNAGSIKRVCYDLIDVDEGSDSVFIHSSTRDYLVRNQSVWFSDDCQAHIYQKCVAYLCNDLSRNLRSLRNLQDRSSPHALYEYAVYNWGEHARRASTEAVKTVGDILNNTRQMATFGQVLVAPKRRNMDLGHDQDVPENIEATHIAAFFGLEGVMASFITQGNRLDPSDSHGRTPLSYAAQKGYHKIVQLLLREEGINLDSVDANGRTPLSWAAGNGYQEVAQLLLSAGARIETQDSIGRTPLLHAALNGHESLVRLMLKSDSVDTNISDIYGYTALSHAAAMGHECTVKFLLDQPKIHADCKDIYGYTPLSHAATYGHTTVVQLLLVADGVDPDSRDLNGLTPLSLAAGNGCTEVVRLLISIAGVNNDSRDVNGVTPLARAAANGQVSVVRVLIIADGVDLDAKDINGQTPYARAAANGHTVVAHILQSAIESR
jgi:ankyrin repeat protein